MRNRIESAPSPRIWNGYSPAPRVQIRDKQRLEQAEIGACMVSQEYQNAMGKAEQKRGHPQVAAIVEKGQPA